MPSIRDREIPETADFDAHCRRSTARRDMALRPLAKVDPTPKTDELLDAMDDKRQRAVMTVAQACPHEPMAGFYPGYSAVELDDGRLDRSPGTGFVPTDELDDELRYRLRGTDEPDAAPKFRPSAPSTGQLVTIRRRPDRRPSRQAAL